MLDVGKRGMRRGDGRSSRLEAEIGVVDRRSVDRGR